MSEAIPFSPPWIDERVVERVTEVLLSGWITTGPKTKLFEQQLSEYCGTTTTICLSSATAGLEMVLRWYGVGPGDEVIIPAYTYCATANVVMHVGATPVMVDVGSDFNIDVEQVEAAITERTKVIIPVDIGGMPCDYDALNNLVTSAQVKEQFSANTKEQEQLGRILMLADAAHSVGASYKGKKTGSLTDVTVFSFHAVKNLTTAEGGAVSFCLPPQFDHKAIYQYFAVNSLHGQSKDALAKTQGSDWRYDVAQPGYKCNMTDIQAAMGLVALERYEENLSRRKTITQQYNAAFQPYDWAILPPSNEAKESAYHLYMLRIKGATEAQRDAIIQAIKEQQVAVNVHFLPLPLLTAYKDKYSIKHFPGAWSNYSKEISLPLYFQLTNEQVERIVKAVATAVEKVLKHVEENI